MNQLLLVAGIHFLAVMSPGPDFAMVMRNSLIYSRRTGILAALGLALGILLHVSYSLLGVGLIISKSIVLFNLVKLLGAGYLIFIGIKSLLTSRVKVSGEALEHESLAQKVEDDLSTFAAIRMGFLTNALNPKVTLFFLALFTQVINPATPLAMKVLCGLEMSSVTFLWFSLVALLLTQKSVNRAFSNIRHYVEKAFGAILVALGIRVALGSHK